MNCLREVRIEITGHPKGKGRGRAVTAAGARVYTPADTKQWEQDARTEARSVMGGRDPFSGPCTLIAKAIFPVPRSWPAWKREAAQAGFIHHTSVPDADNIAKIAQDALNGVVFVDDGLVSTCQVTKGYGLRPGVYIEVRELDQPQSFKDYKERFFHLTPPDPDLNMQLYNAKTGRQENDPET